MNITSHFFAFTALKINKMNAVIVLSLLIAFTSAQLQCPIAGCHPNRCFCVNDFATLKKQPQVKTVKSPHKLSNRGCLANGGNIVCPLDQAEAIKTKAGCMVLRYDNNGSHYWWMCVDIHNSIALPIIDISGDTIASDGYYLVDYRSNGSVVPKPIELYPNTGQIVDMMFTNNSLFHMIYKCGLIVAYLPDGTAWASIWINNTQTTNGTFVPLSTPAISGERMYLLTGFWATNASTEAEDSFLIRLYAIDATRFFVDRLRIAWYYEVKLEGYLSAIENNYESCIYTPPSSRDTLLDGDMSVAQVTVVGETVVAMLNYKTLEGHESHYTVSLNDKNTSYHENGACSIEKEVVFSLGSFQSDEFDSNYRNDYIIKTVQSHDSKDTQLMFFHKLNVCKAPDKSINLSSLLFDGKKLVRLTTDPLAIETKDSMIYIAFGGAVMTNDKGGIIVDEGGFVAVLQVVTFDPFRVTVFWKEDTPNNAPATGQVAVLGGRIVFNTGDQILLYGSD